MLEAKGKRDGKKMKERERDGKGKRERERWKDDGTKDDETRETLEMSNRFLIEPIFNP